MARTRKGKRDPPTVPQHAREGAHSDPKGHQSSSLLDPSPSKSREHTAQLSKRNDELGGSSPNRTRSLPYAPDNPEADEAASYANDPPAPLTKRCESQRDRNIRFWKDRGYYDRHPNSHKPRVSKIATPDRAREENSLIKEKYKLLVNASRRQVMSSKDQVISSQRQAMLLQYPNREPGQAYCDQVGQKPLDLRIKPKCGLVEVDIPVDIHGNYDKEKGLDYGSVLRKGRLAGNDSSYGLPGGLGIGSGSLGKSRMAKRPANRPQNSIERDEISEKGEADNMIPDGPTHQKLLDNFDDANNKGHVLNKITLGGRAIPFRNGDPVYMVATFTDEICTFTKIDAVVQLRPNFHYLDAVHEQDKAMGRYERTAEEKGKVEKAEDVNMVIKDTENNDNSDMYGGMSETAKLLREMRDEPWQHLKWIDQDHHDSYDEYARSLVFQNSEDAPRLVSEMTSKQYLDAISCPRNDPTRRGRQVMSSEDGSSAGDETEPESEDEDSGSDTVSEAGTVYEYLPFDCGQPGSRRMEVDIEKICRMICMVPEEQRYLYERRISEKKRHLPRFAFLDPGHKCNRYFKWRLEKNEKGHGIGPEWDALNESKQIKASGDGAKQDQAYEL